LLVVCGVDDDRARRAISRDRMEAVRVLRPQRREARHRNRAELHESVQPGDVVEAGVQREDNTVTGADTALTQVSSVSAGVRRGVSECPSCLGVRRAVRQEYIRQVLGRGSGRED